MCNNNDIKVSIVCITYNHVDYIRDAIESFLMQKTNFNYEILIHDDASTDGTSEILKDYVSKYSDKIKVIFQKENQYSKGIKISQTYLYPIAQGKYIAICEGDDFWFDPYKLQKQYDYMEEHKDCFLCIHGNIVIDAKTSKPIGKNILSKQLKEYTLEDAISGLGRDVATNTFFYRREIAELQPKFKKISPCGDYIIPILCAEKGKIVYLPAIMSVYRRWSKESVTSKMRNNASYVERYTQRYLEMLKELNIYFNERYIDLVEVERDRIIFNCLKSSRKYIEIFKMAYFKKMSNRIKAITTMELFCPNIICILRKIKYQWKLMLTKETIQVKQNLDSDWCKL